MARERDGRKYICGYSTYVLDGSQTIDRRIDSSRRINKPVVQDIVSSSESYNRPASSERLVLLSTNRYEGYVHACGRARFRADGSADLHIAMAQM
jgi:hypothetical protein